MNKKMVIIFKRVIFVFIFILCIFTLYELQDLKQYNNSIYYEIENIEDFKNINIQIDNLILNIIPTNNSYIKLSRETTFRRYNSMDYSSNYSNGTFSLKKFVREGKEHESRDVITIEIPATTSLDNVTIESNNSEININELNTKKLNINSISYLKLGINNSTLENIVISSEELHSSVINTFIKNKIEYNVTNGSIENKNVTGGEENITNLNSLIYTNETSSFDYTKFNGSNVSLNFLLGSSSKYKFENTVNKTKVDKLNIEEDGTTYTYNKNVENLKEYVIDCNNNPIIGLKIQEKEAIRSEFE